jgi:hypothetical protein
MSAYLKAVLAFVSVVVTNLLANFANSSTPAPQTAGEWITLLVTTLVGTAAVYVVPNKPASPAAADVNKF